MIQIYHGDGKGKTSAAIGVAIRAAGRNMQVLFVQFLKSDDSGERKVLEQIGGITMMPCPVELDFTYNMTDVQKAQASKIFREMFDHSVRTALTSNYSVLIMDEIFSAIDTGMISENEVYNFLTNAPTKLEIVLTGRNPSKKFIDLADYVSNIVKEKHPFDKGIRARVGIEY
ncbi:MAG: cob(I)yrinic acid a,c-diamide adenosyltransferase [Ruminococcus sp.]|nr:cob(I)yrinic acid a,c-diamide adenosyltransferase [Ruminococcus sp.]